MTRRPSTKRSVVSEGLTVEIPLAFKKRGGRKQMIMPDGSCAPAGPLDLSPTISTNATLVRALARAHRWKDMLESGSFSSITELAEAERVNRSYLCRMLRLTLLAPEITSNILDGASGESELNGLMQPFSVEWDEQRRAFS
jgi:hypothetical protein